MTNRLMFPGLALVAILALVLVAGCGDDDDGGENASATSEATSAAAETDGAFLAEMTPHHEAAIEMAEIARERAEHPEVRELAEAIIASQGDEIERMEAIHGRLFDEPLANAEHGSLGMAGHEMGMDMEMTELEGAKPFDRAFIDAMIPHHQGAIRMAQLVLEKGSDPEVAELAEAIIAAQSREIEEMNARREDWYGAPSPTGGIPPEGGAMPSHGDMGH